MSEDYYNRLGWPMKAGGRFFGLLARPMGWSEWHDGQTRFWDGRRARRICQQSNQVGDTRWYVQRYITEDGYGGWFMDRPLDPWFDSYEDALRHIESTAWVDVE